MPAKNRTRTRRPAKAATPPFPLPAGWRLDRGGKSISIRVRTKDFLAAMDLLNAIAPIAEELEHHPDLHLETWNSVRITTWSHDVGGLTLRDKRLAGRITALLKERSLHDHQTS